MRTSKKKRCLSLPELANNGSGPSFHLRGATQSLRLMSGKRNESLTMPVQRTEPCILPGLPHHASRHVWPCMTKCFLSWNAHWGRICHQCCQMGRALEAPLAAGLWEGGCWRKFSEDCWPLWRGHNESTRRNGGVLAFDSTVMTNYKAGLIWIPFLAENSNLEPVIDLMSCFLVTLFCICRAGCVVKKFRPQILQWLFKGEK